MIHEHIYRKFERTQIEKGGLMLIGFVVEGVNTSALRIPPILHLLKL